MPTSSTTCTHNPTGAKCQVVSRFKDGGAEYFTLREIVKPGEFQRSFTASAEQITLDQMAEVINLAERKASRSTPEPASQPPISISESETSSEEEPTKKDPSKVYINDQSLSKDGLANSVVQGIGPITAGRILELRDSLPGKRFSGMEDLKQIKGINWDAYEESIVF